MRSSLSLVLCGAVALVGVVVLSASSPASAAPTCKDTEELVAGKCVPKCPAGTIRVPSTGNQCVAIPTCPDGQEMVGNKCVARCGQGYIRAKDGSCVIKRQGGAACQVGYEDVNGACVPVCATGTVRQADGTCAAPK